MGRAICRLASQESPRLQHEKTGSARRAGCASSRLRQQPAGNSTEEIWSRAMKTKLPNGCLAESRTAPTRATEAQDGMTPATTGLRQ
jgi:hypothetical protein